MEIVEIDNRRVMVMKSDEGYTLALVEKGGPIIFDKDYDKAVSKFKKAMTVCLVVKEAFEKDPSLFEKLKRERDGSV